VTRRSAALARQSTQAASPSCRSNDLPIGRAGCHRHYGPRHRRRDPPPSSATAMHMTAIHVQTKQKLQDRSAHCAEKHRRRAGMLRVYGPIRPTLGVCATTDADRGGKRLISWRS